MGLFGESEVKGRYGVFSIFDVKAQVFMVPFFSRNNATALRDFSSLTNDSQGIVKAHPEDFNLFRVGTWDDLGGVLYSSTPVSLGLAASFVRVPDGM